MKQDKEEVKICTTQEQVDAIKKRIKPVEEAVREFQCGRKQIGGTE